MKVLFLTARALTLTFVSLSTILMFGAETPRAPSTTSSAAPEAVAVSAFDSEQLALFERKAALAKRLGATHVPISDGLPTSQWQYQPVNDPYPAWFIQRPD